MNEIFSDQNPQNSSSKLSGLRGAAAILTGLAALTAPVALSGCFMQSDREPAATTPAEQEDVVAVQLAQAREVLNLYIEGKDSEFIDRGTEQVKAGLTPERLALMREATEAQYGAVVGESRNGHLIAQDHDVYDFSIDYEQGHITYRLSFNQEGEMAGFFVVGASHATDSSAQ
jgi:hypothetical protein